jgi:hypothetical protein
MRISQLTMFHRVGDWWRAVSATRLPVSVGDFQSDPFSLTMRFAAFLLWNAPSWSKLRLSRSPNKDSLWFAEKLTPQNDPKKWFVYPKTLQAICGCSGPRVFEPSNVHYIPEKVWLYNPAKWLVSPWWNHPNLLRLLRLVVRNKLPLQSAKTVPIRLVLKNLKRYRKVPQNWMIGWGPPWSPKLSSWIMGPFPNLKQNPAVGWIQTKPSETVVGHSQGVFSSRYLNMPFYISMKYP